MANSGDHWNKPTPELRPLVRWPEAIPKEYIVSDVLFSTRSGYNSRLPLYHSATGHSFGPNILKAPVLLNDVKNNGYQIQIPLQKQKYS